MMYKIKVAIVTMENLIKFSLGAEDEEEKKETLSLLQETLGNLDIANPKLLMFTIDDNKIIGIRSDRISDWNIRVKPITNDETEADEDDEEDESTEEDADEDESVEESKFVSIPKATPNIADEVMAALATMHQQ